jgi:hypothetical protein
MSPAASKALDTLASEGDTDMHARDAASGIVEFAARENSVELNVGVAAGDPRLMVVAARSSGGSDEKEQRVLERFCSIIIGKPLQEGADHGAIYAAASLPMDCPPVQGVRTPRNAGPAFALAERLIRKIHVAAVRQSGVTRRDNTWYARPGAAWLAQTEAQQAAAIKPLLIDVLSGYGLTADDAWISQIERGRRVTVAFGDTVPYAIKPELMMALERRLRRDTGAPLEVFLQEKKDANAIRRL